MKYTPENITHLEKNEIFVFGSNLAGRHGAGAALLAVQKFGAKYGIGIGRMGNTYAIPTKDKNLKTLPLDTIATFIYKFLYDAANNPSLTFYVTKIGCGLAGYQIHEIAHLFKNHGIPENVILPEEFWDYINTPIPWWS